MIRSIRTFFMALIGGRQAHRPPEGKWLPWPMDVYNTSDCGPEKTFLRIFQTSKGLMGTVRIFMAAVHNEKGEPLPFDEQRRSMIELDKFSTTINTGNSTIRRSSVDSSVTVPFERTFTDQQSRPGPPSSFQSAEFDFCRCGWPHHMLIPKGTTQGFPIVVFAMISNRMDDKIDQDEVGTCNDASSYCGIRDRKYPDKRNMGFPFDRPIPLSSLSEFLRPNMNVAQCKIRFTDIIIPKQ